MAEVKTSLSTDLKHSVRGVLMGGADIIPGVSGGTVALILGIYPRLVTAISHFDLTFLGHLRKRKWGQAAEHVDLRFLVALGTGILLAVATLATLMNYLLENQLQLTLAVFFGLILASSLLVARMIEQRDVLNFVLVAAGGALAYWLVAQPFMGGYSGRGYIFLCGMVAICAMILPGISGAFILLVMGKYDHILGVIRDLVHGQVTASHLLTLTVFAAGCCVGLLGFSKLLRWLLAHYRFRTLAVLCGFMIGSLRKIWPFKAGQHIDLRHEQAENAWPPVWDLQVTWVILLALAAVAFVFTIEWLSSRRPSGD